MNQVYVRTTQALEEMRAHFIQLKDATRSQLEAGLRECDRATQQMAETVKLCRDRYELAVIAREQAYRALQACMRANEGEGCGDEAMAYRAAVAAEEHALNEWKDSVRWEAKVKSVVESYKSEARSFVSAMEQRSAAAGASLVGAIGSIEAYEAVRPTVSAPTTTSSSGLPGVSREVETVRETDGSPESIVHHDLREGSGVGPERGG